MATAEELLFGTEYLTVDQSLRTIMVPSSVKNIGVENDDDVLRLPFKMPRWYGDIDLSKFQARINYVNADGDPDRYNITDAKVTSDEITFSWLVGRHAVISKGSVKFNICLKLYDGTRLVKEFNTTPITLQVLEGLETSAAEEMEAYADVLEQLDIRITDLEEKKTLVAYGKDIVRNGNFIESLTLDTPYVDMLNSYNNGHSTYIEFLDMDLGGTFYVPMTGINNDGDLKFTGHTEQGDFIFLTYNILNNCYGEIQSGGGSGDVDLSDYYTREEVDDSMANKLDKNIILSEENMYPTYGEELLNTSVWTLGEGWSGDVESGFTHAYTNAADYGESLTCDIGATGRRLYEIRFTSSVDFTPTNVLVSIGNSGYAQLYGQRTPIILGLQSVSDGVLEFKPENKYSGTLTITSIREILAKSQSIGRVTDDGENVISEYRQGSIGAISSFCIGANAGGYNADNADGNIGIGNNALATNISGFWNIGVGYNALQRNTAGSRNICIGYISGWKNTVGHRNVAIGSFSLQNNTTGSLNIAIGADSMDHNTTGEKNTAVGFSTMYYNTTGKQNVALGSDSLKVLTTGNNNCGIGVGSGSGIKSGSGNMAIGYGSLSNINTGSNNVAVGTNALYRCNGGGQNVAIGQGAGMGASGNSMQRNVFIGANTGNKLSGSAERNVVIGFNSAQELVTGSRNIIVGAYCEVGTDANDVLNIGNLITGNMASGSKAVTIDGSLTVNNIPTSDPNVAGQIWNDNGTLKVSVGV